MIVTESPQGSALHRSMFPDDHLRTYQAVLLEIIADTAIRSMHYAGNSSGVSERDLPPRIFRQHSSQQHSTRRGMSREELDRRLGWNKKGV